MIRQKLKVTQITSKKGNTFLVYGYWDDKNNNYEYQIYKLVEIKDVAREFDITDKVSNRSTILNSREMCEKMLEQELKK